MDSSIEAADRARTRTAQIDSRIRELRERNEWLIHDGFGAGSTPEQATRAARFAKLAQARAGEAAKHTITAHLNAAAAHDHAAKLFEELVLAELGDVEALAQKAIKHRAWAETEREAARAMAAEDIAAMGGAASALPSRAGRRQERDKLAAADGHVANG